MHYTPPAARAYLTRPAGGAARRDPGPWPLYLLTLTVGLLTAPETVYKLTLLVYFQNWSVALPGDRIVTWTLMAAFLGGLRVLYVSLEGLLGGRLSADLTVALASLAAILLGETWVAAVVVFIALFGECLERFIYSRATRELTRILDFAPQIAHVIRSGVEVNVPVDELVQNEVVVVRPGERIPVDGEVLHGESEVDQSALTGESVPLDKQPGATVLAGTLNGFGSLQVRADRVGAETTLGQVIRLLSEAGTRKARVERLADFYARWFLPVVLVIAAGTFAFTNWGQPQRTWEATLSILVVACPCALILATPATALAATAWLARRGVVLKGSLALERLATVDSLIFDKTGTLTTGKLSLTSEIPLGDLTKDELLRWAAAAETRSEHPLGAVLVREAGRRGLELPPIESFRAYPGAGVVAHFRAAPEFDENFPREVAVGNLWLMRELKLEVPAEVDPRLDELDASGLTVLLVAADGQLRGLLGAADTLRPEAGPVLRELRELGIRRLALVTGDRPAAAHRVANQLGVFDEVAAQQLPPDKARWLTSWKTGGHVVGMVGDGINDAPALALSDVGLALGGSGSDLAAEAGDVVLLGAPLQPLPSIVRLSREAVRIIQQNIWFFAFGWNVLAVILANLTWEGRPLLTPVGAAVFHLADSVLVMLNATRLLWFERWHEVWFGRAGQAVVAGLDRVGSALAWDSVIPFLEKSGLRLLRGAALFAFVVWAGWNLHAIGPDEEAVVTRFGRFRAQLGPGLAWRLPPPLETVYRLRPQELRSVPLGLMAEPVAGTSREAFGTIEWETVHVSQSLGRNPDESLVLTGDEVLAEVTGVISYRLDRARLRDYIFSVTQPEAVLKSAGEQALREAAAQRGLDDLLTSSRLDLETETLAQLQRLSREYRLGVEVLGFSLRDLHPPLEVVPAYREVASALERRQELINDAEAFYQSEVLTAGGEELVEELARRREALGPGPATAWNWRELLLLSGGKAAATLEDARTQAARREFGAAGDADRFALRQAAFREAPALTQLRLYWETLARVLASRRQVILDPQVVGSRRIFLADPERMIPMFPGMIPPIDNEINLPTIPAEQP